MAVERGRHRTTRASPLLLAEQGRLIGGRLYTIDRIAGLHFPGNRATEFDYYVAMLGYGGDFFQRREIGGLREPLLIVSVH